MELEHPDAVLTENMYEAFEKGHPTKVPLLTGICSEETIGMGIGSKLLILLGYFKDFYHNMQYALH